MPSPPRRGPRRLRWAAGILVTAAIVLGLLNWAGGRWRRAEGLARLPSPPAVGSAAVADHLRERYAQAQRDPQSVAAVGPLCLAFHADMLFDLADRCYALLIDVEPDEWRWTYSRALIQSERGGGEALVTNLRRVVGRAPRFGPAWLRLGEAEFKAGRYDAAAESWQRASELPDEEPSRTTSPAHLTEVPLRVYASFGLARVALVHGDSAQARDILERLIVDAPNFGSAFRLLAESYRASSREDDAVRAVYQANRLPPYAPYADPMVDDLARESRNSVFLLRLASEANLSINAEWSEYLTRRALEFDPTNPEVVVKLAKILRTIGRNEEALEFFQRYHAMVPGDYLGFAHIGSCLSALGRYNEAEPYFRRTLAGVDDPLTHYNLGLLLSITGRLDDAVREYEKSLAGDPMQSDARTNLATSLARQGKVDLAMREFARVLDHDPENALARTNLGVVLLQQGRVNQARAELESALRIDPRMEQARQALESITAERGR